MFYGELAVTTNTIYDCAPTTTIRYETDGRFRRFERAFLTARLKGSVAMAAAAAVLLLFFWSNRNA